MGWATEDFMSREDKQNKTKTPKNKKLRQKEARAHEIWLKEGCLGARAFSCSSKALPPPPEAL